MGIRWINTYAGESWIPLPGRGRVCLGRFLRLWFRYFYICLVLLLMPPSTQRFRPPSGKNPPVKRLAVHFNNALTYICFITYAYFYLKRFFIFITMYYEISGFIVRKME